jgi:hypothetical protein
LNTVVPEQYGLRYVQFLYLNNCFCVLVKKKFMTFLDDFWLVFRSRVSGWRALKRKQIAL